MEITKETKAQVYREYLDNLDDEMFGYEFNDRMGCDPEGYYVAAKYVTDRKKQTDDLVEHYEITLEDKPDVDWVKIEKKLDDASDPMADPHCHSCKGSGRVLVQIAPDDVDMDPCQCVINPRHNRFRASIYLDIYCYTEEQAKRIAEEIATHLSCPGENELPRGYCNPYVGGAALIINRDLLGNAKRLEKI